jgi:hypothetical protein
MTHLVIVLRQPEVDTSALKDLMSRGVVVVGKEWDPSVRVALEHGLFLLLVLAERQSLEIILQPVGCCELFEVDGTLCLYGWQR